MIANEPYVPPHKRKKENIETKSVPIDSKESDPIDSKAFKSLSIKETNSTELKENPVSNWDKPKEPPTTSRWPKSSTPEINNHKNNVVGFFSQFKGLVPGSRSEFIESRLFKQKDQLSSGINFEKYNDIPIEISGINVPEAVMDVIL